MLKPLSIVGYLLMVGGLLALLALHCVFSPSPLAIVPQVAAAGLMVWARIEFGRRSFHFAANPTEGGLVTTGPYRLIRHPIYSAVCLFTAGGVATHWSGYAAIFGAVVAAGAVIRLRCEEILLIRKYPGYAEYSRRTKRLIPWLL